jgi:hypothetical protein
LACLKRARAGLSARKTDVIVSNEAQSDLIVAYSDGKLSPISFIMRITQQHEPDVKSEPLHARIGKLSSYHV